MSLSRVVLPPPLGPIMAMKSPSPDRQVDIASSTRLPVVGKVEVGNLDDGVAHRGVII
jgi:hypothetical protein